MKATLFMASLISVGITLTVVLFRNQLMHLFTDNPDVIRIGTEYLVIVGSFYLFFSTMFTFNGVMRGAGDTLVPMFISLFALWAIRIPLAVYLSQLIGTNGIWWSAPASWFTGMLFSFLYYMTGKWKSRVIVSKVKDPDLTVT
jgi:Na+-driven multidrug efflux pump